MIPFGQAVLLWRLHRGLTQQTLAVKARVPRSNLSAIERGKREVSLRTLRSLALALEVRPGVLADGTHLLWMGNQAARFHVKPWNNL